MEAGQLRHRLTIETPVTGADEYGQESIAWHPKAEVWGCVKPLGGEERWRAQQVQARTSHEVLLRWASSWSPAPKDRLKLGDRVFEVLQILNLDERNRAWRLLCSEELSNG